MSGCAKAADKTFRRIARSRGSETKRGIREVRGYYGGGFKTLAKKIR